MFHDIGKTGPAGIRQGFYRDERLPFVEVRTTASSSLPYAPHVHATLSLGLVIKGGTMLRRPDGETALSRGDMILIAPDETHSCNPLRGAPRGYHMFHIDADWALSLTGDGAGARLAADRRAIVDKAAFAALADLAVVLEKGGDIRPGRDALAGVIATHCSAVARPDADTELERCRGILRDGCGDDAPAIAAIAESLGMGREGLIRRFRRGSGMTPGSYRQCQRLIRALEMLRGGASVVQTALACGFADQSHFHRMCVKYLSATPGQLRTGASLSFKK